MITLLLTWALIRKLSDVREQLERSFDDALNEEVPTSWWPHADDPLLEAA